MGSVDEDNVMFPALLGLIVSTSGITSIFKTNLRHSLSLFFDDEWFPKTIFTGIATIFSGQPVLYNVLYYN